MIELKPVLIHTRTYFFCCMIMTVLFANGAMAQAFVKGTVLVSLSEGGTYTNYTTVHTGDGIRNQGGSNGARDPLTIEYGLTPHWGICINMGGDILHVDPSVYYGFSTAKNNVQVVTSELTFDVHYHFRTTKRSDISGFASAGPSGVIIQGNDGDSKYKYTAGGSIIRVGGQARYYIWKGLGVHGMVSAYSSSCTYNNTAGNTVGNGYSTTIRGLAWEIGLCYRIFR